MPRSLLAAVLVLLAATVGSSLAPALAQAPKPGAPLPAVLVQPAELRSFDRQFEFIGRVEAREKVELRARVSGFLGPRQFREGEQVRKGQVLFGIERDPFEAAVAQREAQLASARAAHELARQQLARSNELVKQNSTAISKAQIDQRNAEEQQALGAVLEAEAALKDAKIRLSYTDIRAPIDGRIGRSAVSPGNLVSPETGVLATIVAADPVQIVFAVTQRELLDYRRRSGTAGTLSVQVRLADGSMLADRATIDFLDVQVDPRTDGQIVRATMPNPANLLTDGQTIRVVLAETATTQSLVIPRAAVIIDQSGPYVFIVNDKGLIEQRRVKLGTERGGAVAISEGLAVKDTVVVQGHRRVRPGLAVTTQLTSSPAAERASP